MVAARSIRATSVSPPLVFAGSNVLLPDSLIDTHFTERARLGRSLTFIARARFDDGRDLLGIGLDSETALAVERDGTATVIGAR